jgi:hypothetical protein
MNFLSTMSNRKKINNVHFPMTSQDRVNFLIKQVTEECATEHMWWKWQIGPTDKDGYRSQGHLLAMKNNPIYRKCYEIRSELASLDPHRSWLRERHGKPKDAPES